MNTKTTTRRTRATGSTPRARRPGADGAAGVAAPTAPTATTNAHQSAPTTAIGHRTTARAADSSPTTNTATAALVRAILSTLDVNTAAALVALLLQWLRAVLASAGADRHAVEVETDRATNGAAQLDADAHARALVAALVGQAPHDAVAAYFAGDAATAALLRGALDVLADVGLPSRLAGDVGARVLRASLADCRARAVRAMVDAALAGDGGDTALAALCMARDDGRNAAHTLTVTLEGLNRVAHEITAAMESALSDPGVSRDDRVSITATRVLHWTDAAAEAVEATRGVLRALANGGAL